MTTPPPEYDLNETKATSTTTVPQSAGGLSPTLVVPLIALIVFTLAGLAWWFLGRSANTAVTEGTVPVVATNTPSTEPVTTPVTDPMTPSTDPIAMPEGMPSEPTTQAAAPEEVKVAQGGINPQERLRPLQGKNPFNPLATNQASVNTGTIPSGNIGEARTGNTVNTSSTDSQYTPATQYTPTQSDPVVQIREPSYPATTINSAMGGNYNGALNAARRGISATQTTQADEPTSMDSPRYQGTSGNGYSSSAGTRPMSSDENMQQMGTQGGTTQKEKMPKEVLPPRAPIVGINSPKSITSQPLTSDAKVMAKTRTHAPMGIMQDVMPATAATSASVMESSPINQYLQKENISLSGVVIGASAKTAILKTSQGFITVSEKRKIPNTDITVQEVKVNSVTLVDANQTVTIPLTK